MKTFSEFITEEIEYYETTLSYLVNEGYVESYEEAEDIYLNLDEASKNTLGKLAWKASKAGAKLAWKGVKAATKAVRDYGSYYPVGSKRRAVSDTIDKVHQATLSDEEKRKRRNAVHRARNTRKGREELEARQKKSQEVSDRWHEQQRKKQEQRRAKTGRYRNVGVGSRESVREMKTFSQFIEEAEKRLKFLNVYRGDSKEVSKKIKKNRNAKSSEYGVYGPGVYASTDKNVARHYSANGGNKQHTDVGVTRSRIPVKKVKTIRTPEHNSGEGIQKGRETVYGNPKNSVRIKNAASQHERRSNAAGKKPKVGESDYVVVNPNTFNKGITTQPTIRASNKPQRTKTQPKKR